MSAQDVRIKEITIMLDKERHLRFDLNAFAELEDIYGDINLAFDGLQKGSIKAVRAMLYAGLVHEDETLTLKKVGTFISLSNLDEFVNIITGAATSSLPAGNEGNQQSQPEK